MKRMVPALGVLFLLALKFTACSEAPSEPQKEPTLAEELQAALDAGVRSFKGKGVSAAVIMPDGSTWVGVSGVSHGTASITPDMRFAAGSIGKRSQYDRNLSRHPEVLVHGIVRAKRTPILVLDCRSRWM